MKAGFFARTTVGCCLVVVIDTETTELRSWRTADADQARGCMTGCVTRTGRLGRTPGPPSLSGGRGCPRWRRVKLVPLVEPSACRVEHREVLAPGGSLRAARRCDGAAGRASETELPGRARHRLLGARRGRSSWRAGRGAQGAPPRKRWVRVSVLNATAFWPSDTPPCTFASRPSNR